MTDTDTGMATVIVDCLLRAMALPEIYSAAAVQQVIDHLEDNLPDDGVSDRIFVQAYIKYLKEKI